MNGAIVGCGRMGLTHLAILNTDSRVKIIAACDSSAFVVRHIEKQCRVRGYTDLDEMLNDPNLQFVVVATPTSSHHEVIRRCCERNLHVFAEKPFALELAAGRELVEEAERKELINQVGYVNRFNEVFLAVKEIIASGAIGTLHHFRCAMYAPTVLAKKGVGGWRSEKGKGGGCLLDFASHGINLVHFMFGSEARVAGSSVHRLYSPETEDAVYSTLLYASGLSGHLSVNWSDGSYRKPAYRLEIEGSNGRVMADQHAYKLYLQKKHPGSPSAAGWSVKYANDLMQPVRFYLRGNEFTRQLDYFVTKLHCGDRESISSFRTALQTDCTIDAIRRDAEIKT